MAQVQPWHLGWLDILPEFWVMELITGGAAEREGAPLEWARKLGAQQKKQTTPWCYHPVPRPFPPCTLTMLETEWLALRSPYSSRIFCK